MLSDNEMKRENDEDTFSRLVSIGGGVLVVTDNDAGSSHLTRELR